MTNSEIKAHISTLQSSITDGCKCMGFRRGTCDYCQTKRVIKELEAQLTPAGDSNIVLAE